MDLESLSTPDLKDISDAKVLVVDDNKHNQELFKKFLEVMEISDIDCANDGIEAIEMITKDTYDLIVLDVVMPNMNGEEFLYRIREVPEFKNLPVIVQTGSDSLESKDKMFKAGATDFVSKPVSPQEFFSRVRVHLENRLLIKKLNKQLERMSYSMTLIRKMQESLYPEKLEINAISNIYNVAFTYCFEISEKIGGNYWKVKKIDEDNFLVILGEASGQGIPTAMNVFKVMNLLEDLEIPADKNMGKFVGDLNERIHSTLLRGQYVAILCMWFDMKNNKVHYCNAGYQSPAMKKSNGEVAIFNYKTQPIGMVKTTNYSSEIVDFEKDDLICMYNSFIINGKNSSGASLGIEGIKNAILKYETVESFIEDQIKPVIINEKKEDIVVLSIKHL